MNRDDATKIARRIMDRIEQERTIHLDSMVDEIVAGMALIEPMGTKRVEPSPEYKRAMEQLELQRQMDRMYRRYTANQYTSNSTGGQLYGQQLSQTLGDAARIADGNPPRQGRIHSLAGAAVTHHESDPISGYRAKEISVAAGTYTASVGLDHDGSIVLRDENGNQIG